MWSSIVEFFMSPKVVLVLFTFFLVGYIVFLDVEGGFSESFLHFGPGTNASNTATFLGVKMDSWTKVGTMYAIGFFTALMTTYYQWVMGYNIHSYIYNRAISKVPYSRFWSYLSVMLEPFFNQILMVIQFFTTLTLQLQFILPQFVGSLVADMPFTLKRLGEKKYDSL